MKSLIICLQILFYYNNVSFGAFTKLPTPATKSRITEYLDKYAKDHHIPCFLTGYQIYTTDKNNTEIVGHERWIHANAGGLSDIENEVKCSAQDTMLKVSSVTKPITGALVASLVEAGKLNWDDDVNKYFFVGEKVTITLRNLVSQLAGLRQSDNHDYLHDMDKYHNTTQTLSLFALDPLIGKPGAKFTYSNFGSTVLGAVVEAVEKRSYNLVLDEFLHKTLGMKHAKSFARTELFPHLGVQYQVQVDTHGQVHTMQASGMDHQRPYPHWPCCSVVTTIDDVLTFGDQMLRSYRAWPNHVMKPETVQSIWNYRPPISEGHSSISIDGHKQTGLTHSYVLGWNRVDFPTEQKDSSLSHLVMVSHSGAMDSANAIVLVFPEENMVFGAIANRGGAGDLDSLAAQLYHMIKNQQ